VCLYIQDTIGVSKILLLDKLITIINSLYEVFSQVCISDGPNADFGVLRNSSQSLISFIKRGRKGLFRGEKQKVK